MLTVEKDNAQHLEAIREFGSSLYENRVETLYKAVRKVSWAKALLSAETRGYEYLLCVLLPGCI